MTLTHKQQRFVDEFLQSFNATQAALAAGYSEKTAYSIGSENLKKPEIIDAIEATLRPHAMTAAEVLFHLSEIARGDIGEVLDDNGNLDLKAARRLQKTRLIKRIKSRAYTTEDSDVSETEVELHDRLRALELLAKYHDLTNKVRVEDWRTEAVRLIQRGELSFDAVAGEFGHDLATSLFASAGVPVGNALEAGTSADTD